MILEVNYKPSDVTHRCWTVAGTPSCWISAETSCGIRGPMTLRAAPPPNPNPNVGSMNCLPDLGLGLTSSSAVKESERVQRKEGNDLIF